MTLSPQVKPVPSRPRARTYGWWFSIVLLIVYIALFHLWMHVGYMGAIVSGVVACVGLAALSFVAARRGYFVDRLDGVGHCIVIVDLVLEATLPLSHDHYGFYLCALAFALVLGFYRRRIILRNTADHPVC